MDSSTVEMEGISGSSSAAALLRPWHAIVMVVGLVMSAAGVPGNLLTIIAYFKYKTLHNPTNLLICNQSFGDLFTCLAGLLFFVLNYTEEGLILMASNKHLCLVVLGSVMMTLQSSITNILALSTEIFIAVFCPLHYYFWVTDARVKAAIGVKWSVISLINLLPIFGWETWMSHMPCMATRVYSPIFSQFLYLLPCGICLLVSALESISIALVAVKKQRSVVPAAPPEVVDQQNKERKRKGQFKVTKMLLQVVGVFYVSWIPQIITNLIFVNLPSSWKIWGVPEWYIMLNEWSKVFILINPIANTFIYGYKNIHFRNAFFKLVGVKVQTIQESQ